MDREESLVDGADSLVLKLSEILKSSPGSCHSEKNFILDKLNSIFHRGSISFDKKKIDGFLRDCFTWIEPSDTFLVAKCCNLLVNLVGRQGVVIDEVTAQIFIKWAVDSLRKSADVAACDVLQAIEVVLKNSEEIKQDVSFLGRFLLEKLESQSSISNPVDIRIWRLRCIQSLAPSIPPKDFPMYIQELIAILNSEPTSNPLALAQVWRADIEALGAICTRKDWLEDNQEIIKQLLGVALSSMHLGLPGMNVKKPQLFFPLPPMIHEPIQDKTMQSKTVVREKKKLKAKIKKVGWKDGETIARDDHTDRSVRMDYINPRWSNSDSDFSDNEGVSRSRINNEQARTRHAAINFLIQIVRTCRCKVLFLYYNTLLGPGALLHSLKCENNQRTKVAALAAVTALLSDAKPFLAQAQHSEVESFSSFSGILAETLTNLHRVIVELLEAHDSPTSVLIPAVICSSTLIAVTPYNRLKNGLLSSLFKAVLPCVSNKEPTTCIGAIQALTEITWANPGTSEHEAIIKTGLSSSTAGGSWLSDFALRNLEVPTKNERLTVGWWEVISSLIRNHFTSIKDHLERVQGALLRDLASPAKLIQLNAARTCEVLCGQVANEDCLNEFSVSLWTQLLGGPLVSILQSPETIAATGCDCLSNLGSQVFNQLERQTQLMVMTLLFGCCYHEEGIVRASAIRSLGLFLLSPSLLESNFVNDISDIVIKALSDPFIIVREKAAWSFSNFVDLFEQKREELNLGRTVPELLEISLKVVDDHPKVQGNILRATGSLLLMIQKEELNDIEGMGLIDKSVGFLLKCASSTLKMKVKWNACYALGIMMKNETLYELSTNWQETVFTGLCKVLTKCCNFKVRQNACAALTSPRHRIYYGSSFPLVWRAIVDGFDNADNMPDFKEFKHQDALIQQLCLSLCHLVVLMDIEDFQEVQGSLENRFETLKKHFVQLQNSAPPEKTGALVSASNRINDILSSAQLSVDDKICLRNLLEVLRLTA